MKAAGLFAAALLTAAAACAAPQTGQSLAGDPLRVAQADENYPVTPGDLYTLSYWQADEATTVTLAVGSDCSIDMGIFGILDGRGLVFDALKPIVKARIALLYRNAVPSLAIASPGGFLVRVSGEVRQTSFVPAWGLSRLSEIVAAASSPSASLRDVEVLARDGSSRRYDLFQAERTAARSQDPYVRPGDHVILSRASRTVQVIGEVRRPGSYQLLPEDTLGALIEIYGAGPTPGADLSRVTVLTFTDHGLATRAVDLASADAAGIPLSDGDVVRVSDRARNLPLIYFEGAVRDHRAPEGLTTPAGPAEAFPSSRIALRLKEGETLRDALLEAWDSLSPLADLSSASIIRGDGSGTMRVDLRQVLLSEDPSGEIDLRPFDRVFVPAELSVVFVTGAVASPGSFPLRPGQDAVYSLDLAGGVQTDGTTDGSFTVTDSHGHARPPGEAVQSGDRITVARGGLFYGLSQWFPLVTSTIALVASILTIFQVAIQVGTR